MLYLIHLSHCKDNIQQVKLQNDITPPPEKSFEELNDVVINKDLTKLYLGFDNFRVITKYNRSSKYALAVHQLAMKISDKFYE